MERLRQKYRARWCIILWHKKKPSFVPLATYASECARQVSECSIKSGTACACVCGTQHPAHMILLASASLLPVSTQRRPCTVTDYIRMTSVPCALIACSDQTDRSVACGNDCLYDTQHDTHVAANTPAHQVLCCALECQAFSCGPPPCAAIIQ